VLSVDSGVLLDEDVKLMQQNRTPLYDWHVTHEGRMVDFAGYQMPVQYVSIVSEHQATRSAAGLFDISHMGRFRFEGERAQELLEHLLTRRVTDMEIGQVRYSLMCNAEGGVLDDVLVSYLESPSGRRYFLLVVNASNRQKLLKWIAPHLADFPDVAFNDVTDKTAMLSVQGPAACATIEKLLPSSVTQLGYYRSAVTDQMSKPCIVSRTGYTGEDGFELIVKAEDAIQVWNNVLLAGRDAGIQPVGLGARDTLRLEAGMPLYGHELSEEMDPLTAGLGFAVNLGDRNFVGREALNEIKRSPREAKRVGLKLSGRRPARENADLVDRDNRVIGRVTSGSFSPTLGIPIAMGFMHRELATIGQCVDVDIRGSRSSAEIVKLPFYKRK
jgi:aminomethyltransferase